MLQKSRPTHARDSSLSAVVVFALVILPLGCRSTPQVRSDPVVLQEQRTLPVEQDERIERFEPAGDGRLRGRPLVIVVHGRDQNPDSSIATKTAWLEALAKGQAAIGADLFTSTVDNDVRWVWYEDLVDPIHSSRFPGNDYKCLSARERYLAADAARQQEQDTILFQGRLNQFGTFHAGAVTETDSILGQWMRAWTPSRIEMNREPVDVPYEGDAVRTFLREAVDVLDRIPAAGDAILGSALRDTYSYLSDGSRRCAARQRLQSVIDEARARQRRVILIAHSMGTLVSFDLLNQRNAPGDRYLVDTYITMGSQLGWAPVMRALVGEFQGDSAPVPISIRRWINLRNHNDAISSHIRSRMTPIVDATEFNSQEFTDSRSVFPFNHNSLTPISVQMQADTWRESLPREVRILAGKQSTPVGILNGGHAATNYLSDTTTAHAIAAAWCKAFEPQNARPHECATFEAHDVWHLDYAWSGVKIPEDARTKPVDSGPPTVLRASFRETVARMIAQAGLAFAAFHFIH